MFGDAGSGGSSFVDAEVDALRGEGAADQIHAEFQQFPEFRPLLRFIIEEGGAGFAEGDEEMAIGVGVAVEEDHAVVVAVDDMVGLVGLGMTPVLSEKVAGLSIFIAQFIRLAGEFPEILHAPRRP